MVSVLVQEIVTTWTKQERGGKAATRRNALPEALVVPSLPTTTYSLALVHDKVTFDQEPHHHLTIEEFAPQQKLYFGCVAIAWNAAAVSVTFAYTRTCGGAPERTAYPRNVLTLALDTWGRVLYNGRFINSEGQWVYQKMVFNIGYFDSLTNDIFLTTPHQVFAEMADLL